MQNKIHYEDDFFFLNLQMRLLREGFQLQVDADYFLDKILEDIRFLDSSLGRLLATLKENSKLIRRADYFHNLVKTETVFTELLSDLVGNQFSFCEHLVPYHDELRARLEAHNNNVAEIRDLLKVLTAEDAEKEDVITQEELNLLTTPLVNEDEVN